MRAASASADSGLVTIADAALLLGTSRRRVEQMVQAGHLTALESNGLKRLSRVAVLALAAERATAQPYQARGPRAVPLDSLVELTRLLRAGVRVQGTVGGLAVDAVIRTIGE